MTTRDLFFILFFFVNTAAAQVSAGLHLTGSYNTVSGQPLPSSAVKEAGRGWGIGSILSHELNNWLQLVSGINYKQKNYKISRTGFYEGIFYDYKNGYVQLPLKARFTEGSRVKFFTDIGAYGAYWISSKEKSVQANILSPLPEKTNTKLLNYYQSSYSESKYEFDSYKDNRLETGILIGVGLQYGLTSTTGIYLAAEYEYALTSRQKRVYASQQLPYNRTLNINAGLIWQNIKWKR